MTVHSNQSLSLSMHMLIYTGILANDGFGSVRVISRFKSLATHAMRYECCQSACGCTLTNPHASPTTRARVQRFQGPKLGVASRRCRFLARRMAARSPSSRGPMTTLSRLSHVMFRMCTSSVVKAWFLADPILDCY